MQLQDRHVLITGSGKRIGRAIAERLLQHEIRLSAHYLQSKDEAAELAALGKQHGSKVIAIQADLRQVASIRDMVRQAEAKFGPVDILINNASDFFPSPVLDVTEEQWDGLLDLNLKGQFFLAQTCAQRMQEKGGFILNVCDVNGQHPLKKYTPYVVSKAGLLMLTKCLAKEWAPKIRVNSVSPGAVLLPESYTPEQRQRAQDRCLLKRLGSPEDVVQAVLFLIRNEYLTGIDIAVDGGRSLVM